MKVKRIRVLTSLPDQYSAQLYSRSIPQVHIAWMLRLFLCDDAVQIKQYIMYKFFIRNVLIHVIILRYSLNT